MEAKFLGQLFKYQDEDVQKLSKPKIVARLIGNEPGTGKTFEGIALDIKLRNTFAQETHTGIKAHQLKTLILCPKSVISVWDEHCMELTELDVYVLDTKNRTQFIKDATNKNNSGYFIANWDAIRLMPELQKVGWFHVLGDEIHRIKNRKAQVTVATKKIKAKHKTGMSGTPVDNKPQDLWSIINWLWPSYYTSYWKFVKYYTIQEMTPEGYSKFTGLKNVDRLHKEMEPWFVRRLKKDVLPDLPDKYYTKIWVDLEPKQRRAYDQMRKNMVAWCEDYKDQLDDPIIAQAVVAQLVRLQQYSDAYVVPHMIDDPEYADIDPWTMPEGWTMPQVQQFKKRKKKNGEEDWIPVWDLSDPSAKLDALMELIDDRGDEQIVVFSQFKSMVNLLAKRLEKKGIKYATLTGDVSQADRQANIAKFQAGEVQVFAGTIAAGGVGVTLTAASTIVFIDRSWSPAINLQAEDRVHRIGQKDAVEVIDLMARNTVDLGKSQQLAKKWEILQLLLGDKVDQKQVMATINQESLVTEAISDALEMAGML
jgi:SNF2 family DNA or RNA helicase